MNKKPKIKESKKAKELKTGRIVKVKRHSNMKSSMNQDNE